MEYGWLSDYQLLKLNVWIKLKFSGRRGRTDDAAAAEDVEVEDDSSTPSIDGFGDVCEAVMFNKDGEVISFQYIRNNCDSAEE